MTSNEILQADLLDIIFNNRNKAYGAYDLRKFYNNRLTLSLVIALSVVFLLLLFLPPGQNVARVDKPSGESVVLRSLIIPKPPKPFLSVPHLPHPLIPKTPLAALKLTSQIHISARPETMTEVPPIDAFQSKEVGSATTTGPSLTGTEPTQPTEKSGNGPGRPRADDQEEVEVDRMPEFQGGLAAWTNFLRNNLRVPGDLGADEKITVVVAFKVDTDGTVTGCKIVQSGGQVFDKEVIRVLKRMPKWKPALSHGLPIAVEFSQPVTFVGIEQ